MNDFSPFRILNLKKSGAERKTIFLNPIDQECLYITRQPVVRQPVVAAKKKDMVDLLPYISPVYHAYFKNLPQVSSTRSATELTELAEDEIIFDGD